MSRLEELKTRIKEALPGLECVIGWQKGYDALHNTPLFMRSAEDVDKLEWGALNVHNPAVYLPTMAGKKVGVVVKGCDSRSVVELLQENLINRDNIVIFAAGCDGVVDLTKVKAKLAAAGTGAGFRADQHRAGEQGVAGGQQGVISGRQGVAAGKIDPVTNLQ